MDYNIILDGKVINTIYADLDFVQQYAKDNGFQFEEVVLPAPDPDYVAPPSEIEKIRADVDYLAALGGVEL